MGESQARRDLVRLLKDFKPPSLPWPDVVQRLRQLKTLLRQSPCVDYPLLQKCLLQCLHPSWPTGLHSEALEVFQCVLLSPGEKMEKRIFSVDVGVYATGLFAFYEVAAPENKLALLRLLEAIVAEYQSDVGLYMPGLISSLISGLEDPGNREAAGMIELLFDKLVLIDEATFYSSLWVAVLRSCSEGRFGGLSYVIKRKELFIPNRQLFLNAIISCLSDKEVRVQRLTLDLLIAKVSLTATGRFLDEEKVAIIVAVMRLMGRGRDYSIVRRVLQWVVPEDTGPPTPTQQSYTTRICDYLAQSSSLLLFTFSDTESEVQSSILTIETLLDVLEEQPELRKKLLFRLFSSLISHVYRNQSSPYFSTLLTLISRLVPEESAFQTWEGLASDLELHIATNQAAESLSVIDFTLNYLPLNKNEADALLPVLRLILTEFNVLACENRLLALQIAQTLLRKVEVPPKDTHFQRILEGDECLSLSLDILKGLIQTSISLKEPGDWLLTVKTLSRSDDPDHALVGIELIAGIYNTPEYAPHLDPNTNKIAFDLIWSLIISPFAVRAVTLFTVWKQIIPKEFTQFLCQKLTATDEKQHSVLTFAALWSQLQRVQCENIGLMVGGREELQCMLEGLESESPEIRHATKEWLLDSFATFRYTMDPFLEGLISYGGDQSNTAEVLHSLKTIRSLLQVCGDKLHTWLLRTPLSPSLSLLAADQPSYFSTLVHTSFQLIQGGEGVREDQAVRFSACEVFESILEKSDAATVFSVAKPLLSVVSKAIQARDTLFQLQLLNLLHLVLVRSGLPMSFPQPSDLYSGSELLLVLVTSIESKDAYLQNHWTEFICQIYPVVLRCMPSERLLVCTQQLIYRFANIVETTEVKEHAFEGLKTIVNSVMELPRLDKEGVKIVFVEEFRRKRKKGEQQGWFTAWFRKAQELAEGGPLEELYGVLVKGVEGILKAFGACVSSNLVSQFHASPYGLEANSKPSGSTPLPAGLSSAITSVLQPLFSTFSDEFFASAVALWITNTHIKRLERGSAVLDSQIRLFSLVGLRPWEVLEALSSFVKERGTQYQCIYDVNLVHFVFTLLVSFGRDPLSSEEQQLFSHSLIPLLDDLERIFGPKTETHFWFLELVVLLSRFTSFSSLSPDRFSKLRDFVRRQIARICTRCSDTTNAEGPFPPSVMLLPHEKVSTQAAAFQTLSVNLYPALKLVYERVKDLREQLREPVSILTSGLSDKNVPMSQLTSLLYALVTSEKAFITEVLRDTLTATLRSDGFFQSLEGSLKALREWGVIVAALTPADGKGEILTTILSAIPAGMFTSRQNTFRHSVKALKLAAFFVYSGEEDAYAGEVGMLADKVCNEFVEDDIFPTALMLLRIVTLKLSPDIWNDFYQRLRPYLLTRLAQVFKDPANLAIRASALKLLEMFATLGYDRFASSQWLFLYDTPNVDIRTSVSPVTGFRPILTSYLLSDVCQPVLRQEECNISVYSSPAFTLRPVPRRLFYSKQEYECVEEFQGEQFILYSISNSAERVVADREVLMEVAEKDLLYCESDGFS